MLQSFLKPGQPLRRLFLPLPKPSRAAVGGLRGSGYAALSVRVPTGAGGATHLSEFMEEGARRGLPTPPAGAERVA